MSFGENYDIEKKIQEIIQSVENKPQNPETIRESVKSSPISYFGIVVLLLLLTFEQLLQFCTKLKPKLSFDWPKTQLTNKCSPAGSMLN